MPLPLHDLDVLERDRAHDRVAAERDAVREHRGLAHERIHHPVRRDNRADGGVGGREALRARHDVGPDVVALGAEPVAEPAEGCDDLVGREQDVVAVADLAHAAPVALGWREAAAGVLHRLHVDEADGLRPHRDDRLLELGEQELRELGLGLLRRAVVAIRVRDVAHLGEQRLEWRADRRNAVDRERTHRRAVVGDVARDRLVAALWPERPRRRSRRGRPRAPAHRHARPASPDRGRASRHAPCSTGARASRPTRRPRSRLSRRTHG